MSSLFYTNEAKALLKDRFDNGYNAGTGFDNDIQKVLDGVAGFIGNPTQYRPDFSDLVDPPSQYGHYLHTTAAYAYAVDDVAIANTVATELLGIVTAPENDLYTTYWNTSGTLRWDNADGALWIKAAKVRKMIDSYNFVKDMQTVLSVSNHTTITDWFTRWMNLSFTGTIDRLEGFWGVGWTPTAVTNKYYTGAEYVQDPSSFEDGRPIHDSNGDPIHIMTLTQDVYNNRHWDLMGCIHAWAVEVGDTVKEEYCRNFFKRFLNYAVFSDGTIWEVKRNNDNNNFVGIGYGWTTTEAAIAMAHTDAMGGSFPDDLLYDYTTTNGIINGSLDVSDTAYEGTSTTDGITEKSLLSLIKGQSNYLRSQADGGWNDTRFYKMQDNSLIPLDSEGTSQPSASVAMANLYYKSQELEDLYTYNQVEGYPLKDQILAGYMAPVWNQDAGDWGNLIFGAMWYGQEDNFFATTTTIPMNYIDTYLGSKLATLFLGSKPVIVDDTGELSNLYTNLDAANPDNETNSVANWFDDAGNGEVFESVSGGASDGSYNLKLTSNGANWGRWGITITGLDNTKTYRITYDLKGNNAANDAAGSGFTHFPNATNTSGTGLSLHDTWESKSVDKIPTGTTLTMLLYATAGIEANEVIQIDNINIIEL